MRKQIAVPTALPGRARLVVPVLAATGGSGRTTVARLLAEGLATAGSTVVLDLAPKLSSPWPARLAEQGAGGLATLPPDRPLTRSAVRNAAASYGNWQVLSDGREWHAQPLDLPEPPAAWYQLAAIGGWQAVVADTVHPLAHDILAARSAGQPGRTRGWYELPYSVPVLCAPGTADGIQALQRAVLTLQAEGLPLGRSVAVLVGTSDGRPPAVVRAGATMLSAHTAAVIALPHDPVVRSQGVNTPLAKLRSRTRQAADLISRAVLSTAHSVWGEPLPEAPQPAPLVSALPVS